MTWYHDLSRSLALFKAHGAAMDETCFHFRTDSAQGVHYIGYLAGYRAPYWIGYCDVPDGCEFETAEALFDARVFDGRSLRERWEEVVIDAVNGLSSDDFLRYVFPSLESSEA